MPARRVVQTEALAFLAANPADPGTSVITSLPDLSELSGLDLDAWRAWFVGAVRRVIAWVPEGGAVTIRRTAVTELLFAALVLLFTAILVSLPSPKLPVH